MGNSHPIPQNTLFKEFFKRVFDIVVSLTALILVSPLLFLIALAIKRDSPGPVFFLAKRHGKGGKLFEMIKFRTMYEDPESYTGPGVTAHDDPRITPIGHWLRDTKLNELPQFWNVIKGEMSLVGPRPEDPAIAKSWPREVQVEIYSVKPGITSPASVLYRNEESLLAYKFVLQKYIQELEPDKIRLDQLYVRYRSFWLDLDILLLTLLILLPKVSAYTPPETFLFVGPISRFVRRYINWLSIDILVTILAMGVTGLIWRIFGPLDVGWLKAVSFTVLFAFLFSLIGVIFGTNRISWSKATFSDAYDLLPVWILASCITLFVNFWLRVLPSSFVLTASALSLVGFVFVRFRSRLITSLLVQVMRHRGSIQETCEHALIVGSGRTAEHIAWLLAHPAYSGRFRVVGFIDDNLLVHGMRIYGAKVIGSCKDIPQLIQKYNIGIIILADHILGYDEYCTITDICDSARMKVVVIPDIFGSLSNFVNVEPMKAQGNSESYPNCYHCQRCVAKYSQVKEQYKYVE